ncbi:MAG: hypothetical protein ACUVV3_03965 [Dehalococcoidia bacterium]
MEWAVLAIVILGALAAYVVWQGTRAALRYRELAASGDIPTIRDIVEQGIEEWRSAKPPKNVDASVWRAVQTVELMDVGPDYVRVSCVAEGQYRLMDGRWQELTSPLKEAMAVTAKAAEMVLYELPNLRLDRVQIDVYATYRDAVSTRREWILACTARREDARHVDWDAWTAEQIVHALGARYRLDERGQVLPIDPDQALAASAPGGEQQPS